MPRPSPRSAVASTGCLWPLNSPPPGSKCSTQGTARQVGPAVAAADRGRARPAGAADHARHHRLELRPADPGGAAPLPATGRLCWRLHAGGGRGSGQRCQPSRARPIRGHCLPRRQERAAARTGCRRRATIRDAGDGARVCAGPTGGKREEATIRALHAAWCLALAEAAARDLHYGQAEAAWLAGLDAELDNVRAALAWFDHTGDAISVLRLLSGIDEFWWT